MACKDAKRKQVKPENLKDEAVLPQKETEEKEVECLFFGVDSQTPSNVVLQNNITMFEWVKRNKIYPNFWGRNLVGENALTNEEVNFIHTKGSKIAAIYNTQEEKITEEQGKIIAKKVSMKAIEFEIRKGKAVFLEIPAEENITKDFLKGYAEGLLLEGYTPAFKANTDAAFAFDREYSRGMQTDKEIFEKCLIWAVAPSLAEYDNVTTTHFIHPDNWMPFAPSAITRKDIAVWQYGKDCHPIYDISDNKTSFNINLVRKDNVILENMF